ncbi:MAG: hypothetical protein KAS32_00170 [Candidatus Peribacteraceae bacterium]|nr:hypothetical protein [Candidatus Peribacteraceae bacterium]
MKEEKRYKYIHKTGTVSEHVFNEKGEYIGYFQDGKYLHKSTFGEDSNLKDVEPKLNEFGFKLVN